MTTKVSKPKPYTLGILESISTMRDGRVPQARKRASIDVVLGVLGWAALIGLLVIPLIKARG